MNYVERVLDGVHNVLNLNAATLSGAIDIVVVPQPDGTLKSTPFHVRFGKLHLLNSSEKVVTMYVNDEIVDIQLKLGNAGEAFFVEETEDFVSPSQITSPIGSPPTSPAIFKRTTEMVGGKPVVKEVQTHIDSKMEQMIIEDAQLQPQQVTVIHEDKKEKQEQKAKQKIVIDHEDHKTVLPATLPLPVNAPLTSTHPNQQSSSPVDSVTNNPRVRSESLPSYMLDTALEEMYNENPEAPTKDGKAEQESYFTWRWGGFPKYRGGKTLDQPDSDSETLAKDSAVSSKEAPPVAGWKSLFRIFKGVEPQYLVRDEEIEAAIEASDTPEALPVTDKNNEEQQPLSTSLTLSQPLQLLESSSLTTTPIFVPEEEEDSDSSSDSAEYDDASSENDDPTLQFDMHFEKSKKTPEITHTSSPSTDNDKRDKPIPHTITEQITTTTTTIPSNDNKEKEHLIPRLPLRSSTDGFDVIKDPPTSPKKYQSDKEESVEKKNEPLLAFEELPEIKIEISKCGHIIGPNVNDEVAKQKIFQENLVRYEDICKDPEVILDPNILFKIRDKIYPWSVVGPLMVSAVVFKKPLDPKAVEKLTNKYNEKMKIQAKKGWSYWFWGSKSVPSTPKDRTPEVPPSPKPDVRELPSNQKILQKVIKKSLRPTGDQLKVLKLKEGANSVRFSVTSKLQGTREVHGTIYLWKQDTKVVISDIDGTITKSDVMGHILPMLGRDWSHSGIAELYTNIKKNNYQILYLTARPIGQAGITRGYITTLKQDEKTLPQAPIFMSPNRLLSSFHQEVVARRPDEFKIACLKDIQSLFTNNEQVFYAGFGNRPTDFLSYRAVHVPLGKIFIINYKGEINVVKSTSYRKTYSTLNELVHEMFPPLFETVKPTTLRSSEQWNNWNYWKPPLPNIEEDLKQQQAVVQSKEKK